MTARLLQKRWMKNDVAQALSRAKFWEAGRRQSLPFKPCQTPTISLGFSVNNQYRKVSKACQTRSTLVYSKRTAYIAYSIA
jgi:hypothetical protein